MTEINEDPSLVDSMGGAGSFDDVMRASMRFGLFGHLKGREVFMDQIERTGLEPLAVSPKTACHMLSVSQNYLYGLLGAGELHSYLEGRARRITVESIKRYVARRSQESVAA